MADISALGQLQASEPLDIDLYVESNQKRSFPNKGRYTLRAPEQFTFGKTAAGNLSAQVDPTIVGPTNEGFALKFQRVSAKVFKTKAGLPTSQVGQYLASTGRKGSVGSEPQELADAVEQTANLTYEAYLDWRLYAKGHGQDGQPLVIEGMENFPSDGNGGYRPYIDSPTQKDENGKPVRLWANLYISRYIVPTLEQ